ncbi:ANTAR domain-containing protein [Amycolatopsis sp. NPDC051903]|uniref:ANTAR domain-containing protein n=1 Tax=Amycolatopsis sp. NPDC051903 TaxID=3363936 RepID=UPI0037B0DE48
MLRIARVDDVLDVHETVAAARTFARVAREDDPCLVDLQAKLATRPVIAQALGMLVERYRLADTDVAHAVLRTASQKSNVRMADLARALLDLPRPGTARPWLTGTLRPGQPPVVFPLRHQGLPAPRRVLDDALLASILVAEADAGAAQTLLRTRLRLVAHHGLPQEFLTHLSHGDGPETTCASAARQLHRVVVPDVGDSPALNHTPTQEALLASGIHAVQSTPVRAPEDGRCLAVLSTHHHFSGHTPTAQETAALDRVADDTARWLEWRERDALLGAAERVLRAGLRAPRPARPGGLSGGDPVGCGGRCPGRSAHAVPVAERSSPVVALRDVHHLTTTSRHSAKNRRFDPVLHGAAAA